MNEISYAEPRSDAVHDLSQALDAQQNTSPAVREALAQTFLARVQREIDEQVDLRIAQRLGERGLRTGADTTQQHKLDTGLALGSLGIAIPLTAIAGALGGGLPGILIVWLGIVLVNLVWTQRR